MEKFDSLPICMNPTDNVAHFGVHWSSYWIWYRLQRGHADVFTNSQMPIAGFEHRRPSVPRTTNALEMFSGHAATPSKRPGLRIAIAVGIRWRSSLEIASVRTFSESIARLICVRNGHMRLCRSLGFGPVQDVTGSHR